MEEQMLKNYEKFISRVSLYKTWKESGTPVWVWHKLVEYRDLPWYKKIFTRMFWGTLYARF